MNVGSVNYQRRFIVNGILGAALVMPISQWLLSSVESPVMWHHIAIAGLFGSAAFQYLSIVYARRRGWNALLVGIAGIAGVITTTASTDILLTFFEKNIDGNGASLFAVAISGVIFGQVLWMRANGITVHHLFPELP